MLEYAKNPLREGLRGQRLPEPCAIVIFGASGDLVRRKLIPAFYDLAVDGLLPGNLSIIGLARRALDCDDFRANMRKGTQMFARNRPIDEKLWHNFSGRLDYLQGDFDEPKTYQLLRAYLEDLDRKFATGGNRLFYLATAPAYFPVILRQLGAAGLNRGFADGWARVVIEKPFGRDLTTAVALNHVAHMAFDENQLYRIDHYLGKETVQNIFVFRFANGIFEPLWNRRFIDHVQIAVAEEVGVEGRGSYYETAGALRDMIQNHMLQLLSLVAMEPPATLAPDAIRNEKVKALGALRRMPLEVVAQMAVRGQYGAGMHNGQAEPGYRAEQNIAVDSKTETYVALKLLLDNPRWAGVPFYLRSGKCLPKRVTEIAIQFRDAPLALFGETVAGMDPNLLILRIQPDESISIKFSSKAPGQAINILPVKMEFNYNSAFGAETPTAYERLLLDAMLGDATLFIRADEVEAAWNAVMPMIANWQTTDPEDFPNYAAGSWGPAAAEALMKRDGRAWRQL